MWQETNTRLIDVVGTALNTGKVLKSCGFVDVPHIRNYGTVMGPPFVQNIPLGEL